MDMIPWPEVGVGSGWLFVGVAVWAIFTGRLVPRSTLLDSNHDRDEWRAESRIKDTQILEQAQQLRDLGEVGRTVNSIMLALRQNAQTGGPS